MKFGFPTYPKLNLATQFTILRILTLPIFVIFIVYNHIGWALIIFLFAALTDAVDGFIARIFHQKTKLGTFLDPIADKLLLSTAFLISSLSDNIILKIDKWIAIIVVFRDVVILLGIGLLEIYSIKIEIKPILSGKITTFLQLITVIAVLFFNTLILAGQGDKYYRPIIEYLTYLVVIVTIYSGYRYIIRGIGTLTAPQTKEPNS